MENNEKNSGVSTENQGVDTPIEPSVDYKALYEKLQKDNVNLSKYNKDLKDKWQSKLTEEEQQKAQIEERENYYKNLEKELSKSKIKAELKSIQDEKTIENISEFFATGDYLLGVKELNKAYASSMENAKKKWKEESLMNNPQPPAQQGTAGLTKEQFNSMDYTERVTLYKKDPELYKKLNN